jgi:hypothetical protein
MKSGIIELIISIAMAVLVYQEVNKHGGKQTNRSARRAQLSTRE